jgi:hypothetical protein
MANPTIFAKPWFVGTVIFGCFAILTPKLIIPMVKTLLTTTAPQPKQPFDRSIADEMQTRNQRLFTPTDRASPAKPSVGDSGSRTFLGFILPIYAVGIVVYMMYTLFKIYGNKKPDEAATNEQLLSDLKYSNIKWDPNKNAFVSQFNALAQNDESDENYASLDQDYVEFLKHKKQNKDSTSKDMMYILDTMKESLNNINKKLSEAEKIKDLKTAFDESHTESLKIQLASTELQMARLLSMIDNTGNTPSGLMDDEASSIATTTTRPSRSQSASSLSSLNESSGERDERRNKVKKHSKKEYMPKKNDVYSSDDEDIDDVDEEEAVKADDFNNNNPLRKLEFEQGNKMAYNPNKDHSPLDFTSEE